MKKISFYFPSLAFIFFTNITFTQPLDDIVPRTILQERQVLAYPPLREADIFWEKRIWRIIDFREKMNQPFQYPEAPFFTLMTNAAINGDITLYDTADDKYSMPLSPEDLDDILFSTDTILVWNPDTYEEEIKVIRNELDWNDINRLRIKEQWFFDKNTGSLNVRILGIAPLVDVRDDNGNFRYEKPLFWAYYPELRPVLARFPVFNPQNDGSTMSWEDLMEMRYFASYIFKASNVKDERLENVYSGVDLLMEADKIKQEIFNFEQDLWSY